MSIDEIDLRILDMLQRNGKLSQARIAGAVGLTTPSVNERIKKMERHGMIRGSSPSSTTKRWACP